MDFKATFYNDSGTTKSGRQTQNGVTIAVDPNVIPLGSWVEVKFPDGRIERRRADDTGRLIKQNKIDVYVARSTSEAMELGLQNVQIRVIKAQES